MRILLVKPKATLGTILGLQGFYLLEPLELGYVAAAVPHGHDVRILDLRLFRGADRALRRAVQGYRPDLVGFTGYSHEASNIKRLSRMVRRLRPGLKVVVGGHHATVSPEDYDREEIDAVVRGEGCAPFAAIVEALDGGEELGGIPNVVLPGTATGASSASEWPRFPDPADLPTPRRDLWNAQHYRSVWTGEEMPHWYPLFPTVSMVRSSWGCRMKCTFCVVPFLSGGVHQPRPVEGVVDEIASLPTRHVYFSDDENFIDEKFAWELADALERRGVKKRYFAWTRSTTVNRSPELLRRWRRVGLDCAFLGFEYTRDEELRRASKGATVAANERALTTLRSMGIAVHAAFMVDPDFTEEQFAALRDYVRAMPPVQCSFTVCTPSPGTPDYEKIRPHALVDNPFDLHDCMHPLTPTALPLRTFTRLFAEQAAEGTARTPRRVSRSLPPLRDLWRAWRADRRYFGALRDAYRDYPAELWS